jgi:hypothetical protein
MKFATHLRLISITAVLSAPLASATHYKLFVLTGQSNSLGTTNGGETDPSSGSDPADAHVKFYWDNIANARQAIGNSGGEFRSLQDQQGGFYAGSATHWGPEIAFGRTLFRAGVRDFGIIKASRGGGGNSFWSKTASDHHMYSHVVNTVTAATATLTANGDTFEIVGLLYVQGESDNSAEANGAKVRIKELSDNLRADLPNAANLHTIIGGIAAAGADRDTVRAQQAAAGGEYSHIDFFSNLNLQTSTAADNLHFNKAAKLTIGERFAQAFFSANVVSRHYGKLVFLGDSITQGGNGYPSYRYPIFKRLAEKGVPINAEAGYKFTGSVTGAYGNNAGATPGVNGQVFENVHEGHYGWRAFWENARLPLPAGRYHSNNLGQGTILNWTATGPNPLTFQTVDAPTTKSYTGTSYTPDTVAIMIGINDLADNNQSANQVVADIGTLVDQLRVANPKVRVHINRVLYTNQSAALKTAVDAVNHQLQGLANAKNSQSKTSPVWIIDASTGFDPITMTHDLVHPNTMGENYIGERIAAGLGIVEAPLAGAVSAPKPPHLESGSSSFHRKFEGHEIWNGTAFLNSWKQDGNLTKTLVADEHLAQGDLQVVNPAGSAFTLNGTDTGWAAGRAGDWTFETRLKFNSIGNGFVIWLGTGHGGIYVEIYSNRTQDFGNNSFNVSHHNHDGNFHIYRIAHEGAVRKYHVWRDGVRLTPVAGVGYDSTGSEGRLLMGDYTGGTFGDRFDVTLDYIRYDSSAAYLPTGADADGDGLPDAWEYSHFQTGSSYDELLAALTAAVAGCDVDGDGKSNWEEYLANTDPRDPQSRLTVSGTTYAAAGGEAVIHLPATSPQRNYTLYKSTDLGVVDAWTPIHGPIVGTDGHLTLRDPAPSDRGFYKVGVSLP